jgi:N-acetylmuramoyl-L-alanine amidase
MRIGACVDALLSHNAPVRNHLRNACQALLLVILAGCSSPDGQRSGWTPVQREPGDEAHAVAGVPAAPNGVADPTAKVPVTLLDNSPRWISLKEWSKAELGSEVQLVSTANGFVWEMSTPGGVLQLVPGSRRASWDGVTVWLGYAPFWSDGDCIMHELDVSKNLLPLANGRPISTNPRRTIVIDPGHGGTNTGTRSSDPLLLEKDLTLDWAFRLEPLLRQQGWQVILTRTNDIDLALGERVRIADEHGADLFLSLHFNSAHPQTEHAGLETYCLTPTGLPSTLTRNYDDDASLVFPNNSYDHDNLQIAFRLHRELLVATRSVDRGIRRARFMGVLRGQDRPAVLLEAGYLSNPEEAGRIATAAYRQQLAEAVSKALSGLLSNDAPSIGRGQVPTARFP